MGSNHILFANNEFGNENIAGNSMEIVTARDIVIQLLVDSGIPGYGHRYNLLDPAWTLWCL
jgi:uncharacterized protein YkwD